MIRRLRIKFVAAAMLSLLIVLAALMGSVNLLNYRSVVREADEVLSLLSENGGSFPETQLRGGDFAFPEDAPDGRLEEPPDDGQSSPDGWPRRSCPLKRAISRCRLTKAARSLRRTPA